MISADLSILLPEIVLAVYAMVALIGAVYTGKDTLAPVLIWLTAAVMVLLALWIGAGDGTQLAFGGMFIDDGFARFAKVTILLSAAAVLVMSEGYMARRGLLRFEYPVLVALAVVGMMVMVSAGDLMTLYMGLELQSLALYVVASLRRDSAKSTEAGLKYFVLGALSSGLLLYGASLTYGYAGHHDVRGHHRRGGDRGAAGPAVRPGVPDRGLRLQGLGRAVPHVDARRLRRLADAGHRLLRHRAQGRGDGACSPGWCSTPSAASPTNGSRSSPSCRWSRCSSAAIAAIGQRDIKRLMAYSSIAHMGFALMGLAAGTALGVQAMLIYMAIYVTMNVGTFAFILSMEKDGRPVTDIGSLNMYSRTEPLRALAMLVLLFSLAGVPPMVGFFGKLYVLRAAFDAGLVWLAVAGVVASVIGAFYYLRIVYYMYFGEEREALDPSGSPVLWGFLMASAAIMVVGVVNLFGIEPSRHGGRDACQLTLMSRAGSGPAATAASFSTRSTAPWPRRRARRAGSTGRPGSWRAGRPRPAVAAAATGPRPAATCPRRSCASPRRPRTRPPSARSWRPTRCSRASRSSSTGPSCR